MQSINIFCSSADIQSSYTILYTDVDNRSPQTIQNVTKPLSQLELRRIVQAPIRIVDARSNLLNPNMKLVIDKEASSRPVFYQNLLNTVASDCFVDVRGTAVYIHSSLIDTNCL